MTHSVGETRINKNTQKMSTRRRQPVFAHGLRIDAVPARIVVRRLAWDWNFPEPHVRGLAGRSNHDAMPHGPCTVLALAVIDWLPTGTHTLQELTITQIISGTTLSCTCYPCAIIKPITRGIHHTDFW